jgi:DNA-nicking Smr family endonuclease
MSKRSKKDQLDKELSEEERELFLNVFYQGEIKVSPDKVKVKPRAPHSTAEEQPAFSDQELFLRAVNEGILSAGKHEKEEQRSYKPPTKKQGVVDAKIDLHGMFAEDAIHVLLRFLERERKRGSKTVLVVHGKGMGILRNAVWSVIESHPNVSDFWVAQRKLGGSGAVIVKLIRP